MSFALPGCRRPKRASGLRRRRACGLRSRVGWSGGVTPESEGEMVVAKRPLGSTGMQITRVGFGAWAIGGGEWSFGWGSQEDAESIAAIRHAVEVGINWVATAAVYGLC